VIEIVAAQLRIARSRFHFKHAAREFQNRHIKSAATQIVNGVSAFGRVVQPVGDRSGGRFIQETQHVQASELGGIFGGLTLSVVEVSRHGNHRADKLATERFFSAAFERTQNVGRDFNRAFDAGHGLDLQHARRFDKTIRRRQIGHILESPPHKAFDRHQGIGRIAALAGLRLMANRHHAIGGVMHHGRQEAAAFMIGQHHGRAAFDGGDQRIGRAQINADRQPVLVRFGKHAGFGNLQ